MAKKKDKNPKGNTPKAWDMGSPEPVGEAWDFEELMHLNPSEELEAIKPEDFEIPPMDWDVPPIEFEDTPQDWEIPPVEWTDEELAFINDDTDFDLLNEEDCQDEEEGE